MSPCRPVTGLPLKAKVYSPFGMTEVPVDFGADNACDIGKTAVFFGGNFGQGQIKPVLDALKVFPDPFIQRFITGRVFNMLPRDKFNALPADHEQRFSPRMGIKIRGHEWSFNEDIFRAKSRKNLKQRIWYAVSSQVADDLEGEPGFDRLHFQASFNRYLTKRLESPFAEPWRAMQFSLPGVDRLYQLYFNNLAEADSFDSETLRDIFRETRDEYEGSHLPISPINHALSDERAPWVSGIYDEFVNEGFRWRMTQDNYFAMSLQNARSRERPESSHRLNVHYYNGAVNRFLDRAAGRVLPSLHPSVLWAPGVVGSYETKTADKGRKISMLAGSLLDVGAVTNIGEIAVHSYLGWPVTIPVKGGERQGDDIIGLEPEWEIGLQYHNISGNFIAGAMFSLPVGDLDRRYLGLVARKEY